MTELTRLGKYEIWRELGRGAMGIVYEAFDPFIERTVAIKTILKSSLDKSEVQEAFSRFRREAQAAGRLAHPKIVSIFEYGEDEEMAFIVMELICGSELKEYFDREQRFTIREGISIVLQLLDALDYSHSRGVVHRDIKPANILLTADGQIKVADFGIAKIESTHLTQVGMVIGTPNYMSPEQFLGLATDCRTDIYSAGVVLYQFLTGTRPFTGSVISIMNKTVNQEAAQPSQLNPAVSKNLDEVIKKAMAKRSEDRYQTAAEFMEALKSAADAYAPEDPGKPLIAADEMFGFADLTVVLSGNATSGTVSNRSDIEFWRSIASSRNLADFRHYLSKYPGGEFVKAAKLRIAALEKPDAQVREETRRNRQVLEQQACRQKEVEDKARLARQIAEIRNEGAEIRAQALAQRQKEAAERSQRAQALTMVMAEKKKKLVDLVAKREAEREVERKLEAEARQKLEARIKRRKKAMEE